MKRNLTFKILLIAALLLQASFISAAPKESPYPVNCVRIQLSLVPGHDLPISTTSRPSKAPALCPVALYYDPSTNSLSFISNGEWFSYTLLNDCQVVQEGQSFGQETFTVSVPSESNESLVIRLDVGSSVYEGVIDL